MLHKISFRSRGSGPILILLHGYGGSVHHWEDVAEQLSLTNQVVVPNLSHLFMSRDRLLFSVQIEILSQFIKQNFPNELVTVCGLSFGGALAWGLAQLHPEIVDRFVMINPMVPYPLQNFKLPEVKYFLRTPISTKVLYTLLSTGIGFLFLRRAASIFRDERAHGVARLENLKGRKLMFVADMIANFSWILRNEDWGYWWKRLQFSERSSLLIYCKDDLLFSEESYLKLAELLDCEVRQIRDAGHLASKTKPNEISEMIREYLADTEIGKKAG